MDETQGDQIAASFPISNGEECLQSIRLKALTWVRGAYQKAYIYGNRPLDSINRDVIDPENSISRGEYIRGLLRDARVCGVFAEEIGLITVHDHHEIQREFFTQHPEMRDAVADPRIKQNTLESLTQKYGFESPSELKEFFRRSLRPPLESD